MPRSSPARRWSAAVLSSLLLLLAAGGCLALAGPARAADAPDRVITWGPVIGDDGAGASTATPSATAPNAPAAAGDALNPDQVDETLGQSIAFTNATESPVTITWASPSLPSLTVIAESTSPPIVIPAVGRFPYTAGAGSLSALGAVVVASAASEPGAASTAADASVGLPGQSVPHRDLGVPAVLAAVAIVGVLAALARVLLAHPAAQEARVRVLSRAPHRRH